MVASMIVGQLVGRVDTRLLLVIGLGFTAWSFYDLTGWTPDVCKRHDASTVIVFAPSSE
jgi:DHA2 family multidrug resistance protein